MPPVVKKKNRGKNNRMKKKNDQRKLEILDACLGLGRECSLVGDYDDCRRYFKRAKEGYEEQLEPDDEKALDVTRTLTSISCSDPEELIVKLRNLLKRCERASGEENVVTLETLDELGSRLDDIGEYEEAIKVYERCLAGRMKMLGEDHTDTLGTVGNLGAVYDVGLKNFGKALEYYERALKGQERTLGKNHPDTLGTVMILANVYNVGMKDYGKAPQRALEGFEAQFGNDHEDSKLCARNFSICLEDSGNSKRLAELKEAYPHVDEDSDDEEESEEDESDEEGDY